MSPLKSIGSVCIGVTRLGQCTRDERVRRVAFVVKVIVGHVAVFIPGVFDPRPDPLVLLQGRDVVREDGVPLRSDQTESGSP